MKWPSLIITEEGLEKFVDKTDRWSRIMANAAVLLAIIFIIIPAIYHFWMR